MRKLSSGDALTDSFSGTDTGSTGASKRPRRRHRSTKSKSMSSINEEKNKKRELISEEGIEEGLVSLYKFEYPEMWFLKDKVILHHSFCHFFPATCEPNAFYL